MIFGLSIFFYYLLSQIFHTIAFLTTLLKAFHPLYLLYMCFHVPPRSYQMVNKLRTYFICAIFHIVAVTLIVVILPSNMTILVSH